MLRPYAAELCVVLTRAASLRCRIVFGIKIAYRFGKQHHLQSKYRYLRPS